MLRSKQICRGPDRCYPNRGLSAGDRGMSRPDEPNTAGNLRRHGPEEVVETPMQYLSIIMYQRQD